MHISTYESNAHASLFCCRTSYFHSYVFVPLLLLQIKQVTLSFVTSAELLERNRSWCSVVVSVARISRLPYKYIYFHATHENTFEAIDGDVTNISHEANILR